MQLHTIAESKTCHHSLPPIAGPGCSGRGPRRLCLCDQGSTNGYEGHLYRGTWKARRYLSQYWMHPFKGSKLNLRCPAATISGDHSLFRDLPCLQALLNSSQKYHDARDNFAEYGVAVSDVKIVLPQMMKQKDKAVAGLTSGIEGLFKKNKVTCNLPATLP